MVKVAVIGGGSTYTPELVNGFLNNIDNFPITELSLMDIDPERLEIVGGFTRRMVVSESTPFKITLTDNLSEALENAAYVITQLRVGMMAARRSDEYLGKRHGLIGQETTGIGGMAKALRTIPVILEIAERMNRVSPTALLINFTNPSGLVTEALTSYAPEVPAVGVCNAAIGMKMWVVENLRKSLGFPIEPDKVQLDTIGLNHLTWYRGCTLDGEDVWPRVFQMFLSEIKNSTNPEWDLSTIENLGMIPNGYLQYFYYTDRKLAEQEHWPPSRAEQVMEIEKELLAKYANPALSKPPNELMKRGGAYYSTLATQIIDSHYNNRSNIHVVNIPHHGAVPDVPASWVMEIPAQVAAPDLQHPNGIRPLSEKPLPVVSSGLVSQVKSYEILTAQAAVSGSRQAAYQALLAHPLGPPADKVQVVLEDMLVTNQKWLPRFWS